MTKMINPAVVWVEAGEEIRLYDTASGEFQQLNESAAAIWRLMAERIEVPRLIDRLVAEYAADDAEAARAVRRDVTQFIEEMSGRSLLVDVDAD
jgi:hypothetical protein